MAIVAVLCFSSPIVHGFELANSDPWYYHTDNQGLKFQIPDKAQHAWGSALLNELGKQLDLPAKRFTTPLVTLGAGFIYELWQEGERIGFSEKDLVADALGIVMSEFSSKNLIFYMDYSTTDRVIMFNVVHIFP